MSLEWNFDECKTEKKKKDESHINTIIIQQDDYLIFPGDMAFELVCKGDQAIIGLADPDPGAKRLQRDKRKPVTGQNRKVTFRPKADRSIENQTKDEL